MSRGSPRVTIRVPVDLLAEIDGAIARSQSIAHADHADRTAWILSAIREKLAKQLRGRTRRRPAASMTEAARSMTEEAGQVDDRGGRPGR